ncbi:protein HIDE1-like isoform X2 [Pseudophryne corroboree]|uniref:protein HIDE1-like isoform X2 n=1 Tax=Pseudophryne corroboree TaxID=495146 RepID=UPI003081557F
MEFAIVSSENLSPPLLSVITPGTFHVGQSVEVQCTAPTSYLECFFYLFSVSSGDILQKLQAPENRSSVMFTLHNFPNWGTMMYVCKYQCRVGDLSQESDSSDVLSLTILDGPGPTDSSHTSATEYVPLWVTILVSGVGGFVILVAAVYVTVRVVRRHKQKKQEQRDKESIWIDQSVTKDWYISHQNQMFSLHENSTSETDLPHPEINCKDSLTKSRPVVTFSSFRT